VEFMPIYLSTATYYAESANLKKIYLGFTKDQMSPQRSSFFKTLGPTFASYQSGLTAVDIETPFASMDKTDVVREGLKLGVQYARTWSCMYGGLAQCGVCDRCIARKQAFAAAGYVDTTRYIK
jgi:7-cyano-7-deazaguanine synthase